MSDNLLVAGIAQLLATAGVGTWQPNGTAYATNVTGIYKRRLPPTPDAGLALSTYVVSDDPTLSDSVTGLQVHGRTAGADSDTTDDLMDSVFDQLQGLAGVTLTSGVKVVFCKRQSGVSLGQDDMHRWSRADNYYVSLWRPSPNRI